jgi:hypothetical protein
MIRQNEQLMHYQGLGLHTNELKIANFQPKDLQTKNIRTSVITRQTTNRANQITKDSDA